MGRKIFEPHRIIIIRPKISANNEKINFGTKVLRDYTRCQFKWHIVGSGNRLSETSEGKLLFLSGYMLLSYGIL